MAWFFWSIFDEQSKMELITWTLLGLIVSYHWAEIYLIVFQLLKKLQIWTEEQGHLNSHWGKAGSSRGWSLPDMDI